MITVHLRIRFQQCACIRPLSTFKSYFEFSPFEATSHNVSMKEVPSGKINQRFHNRFSDSQFLFVLSIKVSS